MYIFSRRTIRLTALLMVLLLLFAACGTASPAVSSAEAAPTPTPSPELEISFTSDAENPLPEDNSRLALGASYNLGGTVSSNYPLRLITATFSCYRSEDELYPYTVSVSFDPADEVYSYSFDSNKTAEAASLNGRIKFSELKTGIHTLTISAAATASAQPATLATTRFYVLSDEWEQLSPEDFSETYESTLAFFRDKKRFLYRYQRVWDRYNVADPDWEEKYITTLPAFGSTWTVHTDAKPYFEKAIAYLGSARVRVSGTNGDSGILPLSSLILSYNGCYVPRFISGSKFVSHHAFGTAIDINASLEPNLNKRDNNAVVNTEVGTYLAYNGIKESGGEKYYDFTYTGSYANAPCGVPESVINYLLYELAFYRAGFQWGHYYNSTSDAMHFSLTDDIKTTHFGKGGLGKVKEYYD